MSPYDLFPPPHLPSPTHKILIRYLVLLLITENGGISSSELVFVAFSNAHIGNRLWWKAELVKDEEMYMHI